MSFTNRWSLSLGSLLLLIAFFVRTPVDARANAAQARCNPLIATVDANHAATLHLSLENIDGPANNGGLYAYDIRLRFDPSSAQVVDANPAVSGVQVTLNSDWFSHDFVVTNSADNVQGSIQIVATQLATQSPDPVTGNGIIAEIELTGIAADGTVLEFEQAKLSTKGGEPITATMSACHASNIPLAVSLKTPLQTSLNTYLGLVVAMVATLIGLTFVARRRVRRTPFVLLTILLLWLLFGPARPATASCPAPNAQGEYVIPSGTNSADSQTIVDCAASGQTVVFEGGSYTGGLSLSTPNVQVKLNDSIITGSLPAFTITTQDISIHGPGELDGNAASSAIVVEDGADNFLLYDTYVTGWTNGVEVAGDVTSFKLINSWLHDNSAAGLKINSGVFLDGVVTIQGNLFENNGGSGIDHQGQVVLTNGTTVALPARYNGWGSILGASAGDGVSGSVDSANFTYVEKYLDVDPTMAEEATRTVVEGETFSVELKVDAHELFTFETVLTFDTDYLTFQSVQFSADWEASEGSCLTNPVQHDPANGVLHLACTRLNSASPIAGSDQVLAELSFSADLSQISASDDGPWTTDFDILHIDSFTANQVGTKIFITNAGFDSTASVGRDISDVLDGEIVIDGIGSFVGYVDLQGRAVESDTGANTGISDETGGIVQVFDIMDKGSATLLAQGVSDATGAYTTDEIAPSYLRIGSSYYLYADAPLYLPTSAVINSNYAQSKLLSDRPHTPLAIVRLLGGDATDDNYVNVFDLGCIGGNFGQSAASCDAGATANSSSDVNGDNTVNVFDLGLVGGNFYKSVSPWTP